MKLIGDAEHIAQIEMAEASMALADAEARFLSLIARKNSGKCYLEVASRMHSWEILQFAGLQSIQPFDNLPCAGGT